MAGQDKIIIQGLKQNNLKNVSLDIPKGKIGGMLSLLSQEEPDEVFSVEKIALFHREGWKWVLDERDVVTLSR